MFLWFVVSENEKTGVFSLLWMFLERLCVLVNLFDVFLGCQHQIMDVLWFVVSENVKNRNFLTFMSVFMVFVSENLKNRNFVTFMDGFMVFVSENGKTGTLSLPSCCCSMQML